MRKPFLLMVISCASGHTVGVQLGALPGRVERSAVSSWPADVPACTLTQNEVAADSDCNGVVAEIARSPNTEAFARFGSRYGVGSITWSALPLLGERPFAHVEVVDGGLHVGGVTSIAQQRFRIRRPVEIVPGVLWIRPGRPVSILGTTGARIAVAADTGLVVPSKLEAMTTCDQFGAERSRASSASGPPFAVAVSRAIDLFAAPNGHAVFAFEPRPSQAFVWREARGGFVHVATPDEDPGSIAIDGWVRAADVRLTAKVDFDRDSGVCADFMDRCKTHRASVRTPVFVGPASPQGAEIGWIAPGTSVRLGARAGAFVSFITDNEVITAAGGQAFWLRAADVSTNDDDCPE